MLKHMVLIYQITQEAKAHASIIVRLVVKPAISLFLIIFFLYLTVRFMLIYSSLIVRRSNLFQY